MSRRNLDNTRTEAASAKKASPAPSKPLGMLGAVGLAVAAAMTPADALASWNDDGCDTPSIGAIWDLAGDYDSDDHLVLAQSDYGLYLKNSGTSGYTQVNSVIEAYDSDYAGHILRPHVVDGDRVLVYDYSGGDFFEVSLSELRTGSLSSLTIYDGDVGSHSDISDGRVFSVDSSDRDTVKEFFVGSSPSALFADPSGDTISAIAIDLDEDIAYGSIYGGNVREYTGISGTLSATDLSFAGQVSDFIHEDDAGRGYRTLWVVDFDAASGGDACAYIETSYPTPALTDTDGDGVPDDDDSCPTEDATGFDADGDGCLDDADGDGSTADLDCDDENGSVYPGAAEICDDEDNDCDGDVDEDAVDAPTWYADTDGDGYGDSNDAVRECDQPSGYVDNAGDCDDENDEIFDGCENVIDLGDGLVVSVAEGVVAEDSVSFDEETQTLYLLVEGIQYTINVGSNPILAAWEEQGVFADLGADARAEIMLGVLAGAMPSPDTPPPPNADDLAECEGGVQHGSVDTDNENDWFTVTLLESGSTKSTVDLSGSKDMVEHHITPDQTLSIADTTYCPEEEPPDADGDGVPDAEDACPNEDGEGSADGCPEEGGDDTGDSVDPDPDPTNPGGCDASCSFSGVTPGPNALKLAALLGVLIATRRRKNDKVT